jgi:Pyruvate/2-oxoacid:ferredoxin oxidoreductase delta subunit
MKAERAYRIIAEKYLHAKTFKDVVVPDSLMKLLRFTFTEEEAEIVAHLGLAMKSVKTIAKAVNRPVEDINPILASLAERMLIIGLTKRKVPLYGLLNFYPGLYEAQMVLSERKMREGDDGAFYKEFARLFKDFWEELFAWMRTKPGFADRYQILGTPLGRIISIEEAIDASPGLGILSYSTDKFSEMADRARRSICQIDVCTCRQEMHLLDKTCSRVDKPTSVTCTLTGTVAEAAIKSGMARRISKEQFIESRMQAGELGLVAMTDDTVDPLLICTCCDCCCSILRVLKDFNSPNTWAQSHFEAVIDREKCKGCKTCAKACPMDAIKVGKDKKAVVDYARCIGCGVCVVKCDKQKAITFKTRKIHKPPVDNLVEFWMRRYFQLKGREENFLPKLTLGATRALSRINPIHLTGPRARRLMK